MSRPERRDRGTARFVRDLAATPLGEVPWLGSARRFHETMAGYAATPLVDASAVAEELGVAHVWVKDESRRLGPPSFKILGASWAVHRALCDRIGADVGEVAR